MNSVIISGICGNAGKEVYNVAKDRNIKIACGIDKQADASFDCPVYMNFENISERADAVIDFSSPNAQSALLKFCMRTKTPLVIATTGQSEQQLDEIHAASNEIPVLKLSNTAPSVNIFISLIGELAEKLNGYDIEIVETHHRTKKDAPSGTAKRLAEAIKNKIGVENLNKTSSLSLINGTPNIHSIRGGAVVGDHTAIFLGEHDSITITHRAFSKRLFAEGAINAAYFIYGKPNGFYDEKDIFENTRTNV